MSLRGSLVVWRATRAVREANAQRRRALERELADYRSEADCLDLGAALDRYPDGVTAEIRDILGRRRLWRHPGRFPG
ncbi:MAG TPA: hypothetical protein VIU11_09435, partial [Nakamurella sp.]